MISSCTDTVIMGGFAPIFLYFLLKWLTRDENNWYQDSDCWLIMWTTFGGSYFVYCCCCGTPAKVGGISGLDGLMI